MSDQRRTASPEKAKQRIACRESRPATVPTLQGGIHPILHQQRTIGNHAVGRLLHAKRLTPQGTNLCLQRKLTIGTAGDQYEQDADRVADQVMRMPEPTVQRACAPCAVGGPPCLKCEGEIQRSVTFMQTPASMLQRQVEVPEEIPGDQSTTFAKKVKGAGPLSSPAIVRTTQMFVQLQDDKKDTSKPPETQPKTPLEEAKALVQESPTTVKDQAAWILKAADQGFVTFNTTKARENVENLRDEKKVENLDPKAPGYKVPIFNVEVGLARRLAQPWIDAKGVGSKPSIQFGSMIRAAAGGGLHGEGRAIDLNALSMETTVDPTILILNNLDKDVHNYYGLGFPFQGEFFDKADNLETKKAVAESSAANAEKPKNETGDGTTAAPDAGVKSAEKAEAQPVTAMVKDAVKKFASPIYQSTGTKRADGKWTWQDSTQEAGGAYKQLKSQRLKDTLANRRKEGFRFEIFPDNDNHLHLDAR